QGQPCGLRRAGADRGDAGAGLPPRAPPVPCRARGEGRDGLTGTRGGSGSGNLVADEALGTPGGRGPSRRGMGGEQPGARDARRARDEPAADLRHDVARRGEAVALPAAETPRLAVGQPVTVSTTSETAVSSRSPHAIANFDRETLCPRAPQPGRRPAGTARHRALT